MTQEEPTPTSSSIDQLQLHTERLILQPLVLEDADSMYKLLQEREIAYNTVSIPFPYENGMAESFIQSTIDGLKDKNGTITALSLSIRRQSDNAFMGAMCFDAIDTEEDENTDDGNNENTTRSNIRTGTMGYWLGKPYWGHGYCTEAARELIRFGFLDGDNSLLNLDMVKAHHYSRNPASGNVMTKIGLKHVEHLPKHVEKWGVLEDVEVYAISKKEFLENI